MAVKIQNHTAMAKTERVTAPCVLNVLASSVPSTAILTHQTTSATTPMAAAMAARCRTEKSLCNRCATRSIRLGSSVRLPPDFLLSGRFNDEWVR